MKVYGININCKEQDFVEQILSGTKTIETRDSDSLHSLVGKRVGLVRTGCGKAMLMGYADITGYVVYGDVQGFRKDYDRHRVSAHSKYDFDIKRGAKWGYILENVERCEPKEVTAKGIVMRKLPQI